MICAKFHPIVSRFRATLFEKLANGAQPHSNVEVALQLLYVEVKDIATPGGEVD